MVFTEMRALTALFSMINRGIRDIREYNQGHPDFPMKPDVVSAFMAKRLVYAVLWAFSGDCNNVNRLLMCEFVKSSTSIPLPPPEDDLMQWYVTTDGEWAPWRNRVPSREIETHKVGAPDVVIPTIDTIRHEEVLRNLLSERRPLLLCGPPGSGLKMIR